jgi:uncharacterized protein (DUF2141 family)
MKFFYLLCFVVLCNIGYSQTFNLELTVTNIKTVKGEIIVAIFNNENSFLKENKEFKKYKIKINNYSEKYTVSNLPKGKYAISLFHDENSDKVCNLNFLGIPKEGYGFSNNFTPILSAPTFEECVIDLQNNTSMNIKLIY